MTPDARIGTVLAGCRIESEVGRGGMGVVYLAEHLHLGRKVALKLLPPEYAENEGFRDRFVRESRVAATIDHPNVIPVYDAGETDGLLYISMRYVDGEDLNSLINREAPLGVEHAVEIIERVASALDAAHEEGLVHRDVKPGNVLLGKDGHVFLTDFGLTKRTDSKSGLTGTGFVVGTVSYMAPEQFRAGELDTRTDVYSLGCVLYKCLTGHTPFERDTEAATMYAHLSEPPPKPSEQVPGIPAELDDVVAKAMAKRMEDRYASCGECARAARAALASEPTTQPKRREPTAQTAAASKPRSRLRRRLLIAAASVAALLVALVIVGMLFGNRPSPTGGTGAGLTGKIVFSSKRTGNWDVYVADPDGRNPRNLTNAPSDDFPAAPSPDGTKIAFRTDRDGNFEIYSMNVDGSDIKRLTNEPAEDLFPVWSPNGKAIVFTSERSGNKDLYLMEADGSRVTQLTRDDSNELNASFSPDGKSLLYESDRFGSLDVFVLSLQTGKTSKLTSGAGAERNAVWSPKGDLIAYTSDEDGNDDIFTMRTDGTDQKNVSRHPAQDFYLTFTPDGAHIVFQTSRTGNDDIWIMSTTGANARALIQDPEPDHVPRWAGSA